MYACMYVCMHVCMYVRARVRTYIHISIHMYIELGPLQSNHCSAMIDWSILKARRKKKTHPQEGKKNTHTHTFTPTHT